MARSGLQRINLEPWGALELRYINGGAKKPIVFLHEGLGSVAMWSRRGQDWPAQLCALTGRPGIVYSRLGYGQSDAVADVRGAGRLQPDYMHREAWEVLPALLQQQRITRPVLLGHSDGGTIALLYAARFDPLACVVLAPHVMVEDCSIAAIESAREQYLRGNLKPNLARYHQHVDCAFWQWNDAWLNPGFRNFDIRPLCRSIRAPVLAVQGEQDPYGTMAQVQQIEPTQNTVQIEKLAACGHSPHVDQAQLVHKLVAGFLQNLD